MSETEDPMAPWAFRAALSGLPDGDVRSILESDRCPQPDVMQDYTVATEQDDTLNVYRTEEDGMWLRSDEYVSLASVL